MADPKQVIVWPPPPSIKKHAWDVEVYPESGVYGGFPYMPAASCRVQWRASDWLAGKEFEIERGAIFDGACGLQCSMSPPWLIPFSYSCDTDHERNMQMGLMHHYFMKQRKIWRNKGFRSSLAGLYSTMRVIFQLS